MTESVSVSGLIESMRYNGGHSTKQSSTVTMAVTHKFSTEVATLIEDFQKKGIEPQEGLIRLELIAHYADDRVDPEEQQYEVVADGENEQELRDRGVPEAEIKAMSKRINVDDSEEGEQIIEDLTGDLDGVDLETEAEVEEAPSE